MANKKQTAQKEQKSKRHPFKDFKAELKKVIWPTPKQLLNSIVAVITIVLVVGILVFVLDLTFNALNQYESKLQTKLRKDSNSIVAEENTISEENSDEASSVENDTTENEQPVQDEQ